MNFEPAEKMKNFEAGIFQILDKKKKKLESKKLQNNHRSSKSTALFLYLKSQYNPSNKIQIEDIVPCHTKVWGAAMLLST